MANRTKQHGLLQPNTISRINSDNYKVVRLGQGTQAAVWLVVDKVFYDGQRDEWPQGYGKAASTIKLGKQLSVAKAEAIGALSPLRWDLFMMRHASCVAAAARGYTPALQAFDAHNPRWYTASYEGATLSDVYQSAMEDGVLVPLDLVWTMAHQLVKMVCFLHHGVDRAGDAPGPGWAPVAHCDIVPFNVVCRAVKGRLQLSIIDWGRAVVEDTPNPGWRVWNKQHQRMDTFGVARIVHFILEMSHSTGRCKCTAEDLEKAGWNKRPQEERAALTAFFTEVMEPLCLREDFPGRRSALDVLKILENPRGWKPIPGAKALRARAGLTPQLKPYYERHVWSERAALKAAEEQYRAARGMAAKGKVVEKRERPRTRANPGP